MLGVCNSGGRAGCVVAAPGLRVSLSVLFCSVLFFFFYGLDSSFWHARTLSHQQTYHSPPRRHSRSPPSTSHEQNLWETFSNHYYHKSRPVIIARYASLEKYQVGEAGHDFHLWQSAICDSGGCCGKWEMGNGKWGVCTCQVWLSPRHGHGHGHILCCSQMLRFI